MTPIVPEDLLERLNTLPDFLSQNLLGQDEPLTEISELLQRSFCGMRFDGQPVANILLLGPTGVGKTAAVELWTEHIFGSVQKLIRLDMAEYQNQSALERLIGNKIGDRGLLGTYYDRAGRSGTLLFDEIEKADIRVLDVLLQILSAGRFTLGNGETLDLSNFVVAATSNIGSVVLMASRSTDRETIVRRTGQAVEADMRPEIVARFDLISTFNKLNYESLKLIAKLHMEKCLEVINGRGHEIAVDPSVLVHIQMEGYSEKWGARPTRAAAMRILGGEVAKAILKNHGIPVTGTIVHHRRTNGCELV